MTDEPKVRKELGNRVAQHLKMAARPFEVRKKTETPFFPFYVLSEYLFPLLNMVCCCWSLTLAQERFDLLSPLDENKNRKDILYIFLVQNIIFRGKDTYLCFFFIFTYSKCDSSSILKVKYKKKQNSDNQTF